MAKKVSKKAAAPQAVELLEAKVDALEDEVVALSEKVDGVASARSGSATFKTEDGTVAGAATLPTFEHGGETYRFKIGAFRIAGVRYTAQQAVENAELLEKIVNTCQGVIQKL